MLRHAHFYIKGGNRTFAAVCIEVRYADEAAVGFNRTNVRFLSRTWKSFTTTGRFVVVLVRRWYALWNAP
jgi:hypothetical protein